MKSEQKREAQLKRNRKTRIKGKDKVKLVAALNDRTRSLFPFVELGRGERKMKGERERGKVFEKYETEEKHERVIRHQPSSRSKCDGETDYVGHESERIQMA